MVHPFTDEQLGSFYFSIIKDKTALNILAQVFLEHMFHYSQVNVRNGNSGHMYVYKKMINIFQSNRTNFHLHQPEFQLLYEYN